MYYYVVYKLKQNPISHVAGPYKEFEYIYQAMDIISYEGVYDLDILNEQAVAIYNMYHEVESEYKEAQQNLIDSSGHEGWTVLDQLESNRMLKDIQQEIIEAIFKEDATEQTLNTISTLETIENTVGDYDPYDCPF